MRIFGRTAELAALEEEWARAARGEFRGVLLLGDAGIGKSRLAAAVLERHFDEALGLGARARRTSSAGWSSGRSTTTRCGG
ncbi:MAG: AAA family ATPase [Actinomycetota bacterium]|jgi:chromosomal replication initiation ATPase DnaA